MKKDLVVVVGAGIAGLTAASILAHEGLSVILLESHHQPGGCAGTFKRGRYVFDVGATQIAGMESGGIHNRIFSYLEVPLPRAELLELGCLVDLADGSEPIRVWHDPNSWRYECQKQFPGSERFWKLCKILHESNWRFASQDPILPPRTGWDIKQLLKALNFTGFASGLFLPLAVTDLLRLSGCEKNVRLRRFLDLQIKLYSQEPADRTAALYGATVLQMPQAPLGLWHIQGSMQTLSDSLLKSFLRDGGKILLGHRVIALKAYESEDLWEIQIESLANKSITIDAKDIIFSLPPQSLLKLISKEDYRFRNYYKRISDLPSPSGAVVFYGAVNRNLLPNDCPAHIQIGVEEPGSLFVSISREGDGRAPLGEATVIASLFTKTQDWFVSSSSNYQTRKHYYLKRISHILQDWFGFNEEDWNHQELATPKSFAYWTGRPDGIVGGLGQHQSIFGPFGMASRTPLKGLWLCGDSIYPGEGTAGVSQSALMASRQLLSDRNLNFRLPN